MKILIKADYKFVARQSNREIEARKESIKQYEEAVKKIMSNFDKVTFQQILRSKNEKACRN